MTVKPLRLIFSLITILLFGLAPINIDAQSTSRCDLICGKWMSSEKNLSVLVYKEGEQFKAKIIWFDDSDDKSRPMETRQDTDNPDPSLRNQKILGSSILRNLVYQPSSNSWENGLIYDAKHGRHWNSAACITPQGVLKVTGYWHFKFIGKTLTFTRV
ncbi:DUF2147 domain-containing protein [Mucilaginibacter paludis]|uniref:DUF2147 domain-containing protein n=1 Tax=Mucilaginibacter paludis DSM 18603 TaxID=714943 RepID=H1YFY3_9SPHI|nr:DUF2147 domain-containing protein [Mucilaginibacter paludis]EHQ26271.1 Protein of unknown function DUF2147 [Mucilaginibacter paludis DSM 18603]